MFWIGLFFGFLLGVITLAAFAADRMNDSLTIDDIEKIKTDMCEKCNVSNQLESAREDVRALTTTLLSVRRKRFKNEHARILYNLWDKENKVSMRG